MNTRLYLDSRHLDKEGKGSLYISICKHGKTAYYNMGVKILPSCWDAKKQKMKDSQSQKYMRLYIEDKKQKFDNALMMLDINGELGGLSAMQIKDKVTALLSPEQAASKFFINYFEHFADTRRSENTKRIYRQTIKKIRYFSPSIDMMKFEDITKRWLEDFEHYLSDERGNDVNTIAIDMRNIRAVVNDAIDNDITSNYPFRKKYKIKQKRTRKRALSVKKLRELFNHEVEPFMEKYIDVFKLTFFLIGINTIDLCNLTQIDDGRIIYERAKTKRLYSIKVEPEALEIINKYKGKDKLLN
ncbi:MAG: site-specific integrase, partial [Prevotella sp.]|nr:site-specific integrase [Prevotella sp.]